MNDIIYQDPNDRFRVIEIGNDGFPTIVVLEYDTQTLSYVQCSFAGSISPIEKVLIQTINHLIKQRNDNNG